MKVYFNNLGIEKERVLDDIFVKGDIGRKLEIYVDNLNVRPATIVAKLIIGWANGVNTNALVMNKFIDGSGFYIVLPTLVADGITNFTIGITDTGANVLSNTPIFTRNILASVDASDETYITPTEYDAMQNAINENASNIVATLQAAKDYTDEKLDGAWHNIGRVDITDNAWITELVDAYWEKYDQEGQESTIKFYGIGYDEEVDHTIFGYLDTEFALNDIAKVYVAMEESIRVYEINETNGNIDLRYMPIRNASNVATQNSNDYATSGSVFAKVKEHKEEANAHTKAQVGLNLVENRVIETTINSTDNYASSNAVKKRVEQAEDAVRNGYVVAGQALYAKRDEDGNDITSYYVHRITTEYITATGIIKLHLLNANDEQIGSDIEINTPAEKIFKMAMMVNNSLRIVFVDDTYVDIDLSQFITIYTADNTGKPITIAISNDKK